MRKVMKPLRISSRHDGACLRLMVDRPKGNVITAEIVAALRASLADIREDAGVKLVTIEGAGDHFSFGASVEEHLPAQIGQVLPALHGLVRDLLAVPAPTAAIVRGLCLGGGFEIALACDFIFAADGARLGVPEIALGVFPPVAAALLPVKVGAARATQAILTGEQVPASRWLDAGLVTLVAPAADLEAAVEGWFDTHLRDRSAVALRLAARATRAGARAAAGAALDELERLYLERLMQTHDAVEGIMAFLEKRPPHWRNV
jgi:cyclohexa-1,5-dienecarbonyl-CoA hydratase